MQGEHGLPLATMGFHELEEAKKLEEQGFLDKITKKDKTGKYLAYMINKEKFDFMGWDYNFGMNIGAIDKMWNKPQ